MFTIFFGARFPSLCRRSPNIVLKAQGPCIAFSQPPSHDQPSHGNMVATHRHLLHQPPYPKTPCASLFSPYNNQNSYYKKPLQERNLPSNPPLPKTSSTHTTRSDLGHTPTICEVTDPGMELIHIAICIKERSLPTAFSFLSFLFFVSWHISYRYELRVLCQRISRLAGSVCIPYRNVRDIVSSSPSLHLFNRFERL